MAKLIINASKKYPILKRELKNYTQDAGTGLYLTPESKVKCIHCGEIYNATELQVYEKDEDGENTVLCKNAPACSGSIIDIIDPDDSL